jgi:hypothetical protein
MTTLTAGRTLPTAAAPVVRVVRPALVVPKLRTVPTRYQTVARADAGVAVARGR